MMLSNTDIKVIIVVQMPHKLKIHCKTLLYVAIYALSGYDVSAHILLTRAAD